MTSKWLQIGTSPGAANLYNVEQFTMTERTIGGLPTTGVVLYARLWSLIGGSWVFTDYSLRAADATLAVLTPPGIGSKLASASTTFTWTKPA